MPTYQRSVRVRAPLDDVWEFHSTPEGLKALTPDWMNLRVLDIRGPDSEADPEVLETGSILRVAVRPGGVGPRQEWVSEISAREHTGGAAYFTDVMTDGPFREWTHTHLFYADGEETIVRDEITYEFPLGALGELVGCLGFVGFEPMFRYRHNQTKALLE